MVLPPPPHPNARPHTEPGPPRDPGDQAALANWLAHVEAGRVGGHLCRPTASLLEASLRPTASLLEAGNPPMSEAIREQILANERLMRPDRLGNPQPPLG
jgi:hypothetical protein